MLSDDEFCLELRTQFPAGLLGTPLEKTLLSWRISTEITTEQIGFEAQAAEEPTFQNPLAQISQTSEQQIEVQAPGPIPEPRQRIFYRVRVRTPLGWSGWSNSVLVEGGLQPQDVQADAISTLIPTLGPVSTFRKVFEIDAPVLSARLYVTAHGLYDSAINGAPVSSECLNPGWTAYQSRLTLACFDVTDLIRQGSNCLTFEVADGWHRGRFGFMNQINNYGSVTSVLAQLEIETNDGRRRVIKTDSSFSCSESEISFACIYDGCTIDFRNRQLGWQLAGFDDTNWAAAKIVDFEKNTLTPRSAEPVIRIAEFPMSIDAINAGFRLTSAQNISGWVRLRVLGKRGQRVVVRHAEVLDLQGSLHTAPLRTAKATDEYILDSDGLTTLEPRFTYHGFQFAEVETEAQVLSADAIAIASGLRKRANFTSSHAEINQLHSNTTWSLWANYMSLPTDCPQRDERMGWTGDAQAFAYAAATLVDELAFMRSWLFDLRLDQTAEGDVPVVVPNLLKLQPSPLPDDQRIEAMAGWGDAVTVIPWALYQSYGSALLLSENFTAMQKWVDFLIRRKHGTLLPESMQLGDWLDPDAPAGQPAAAKVSGRFVANAFLAHSLNLVSKVASVLGLVEAEKHYTSLFESQRASVWEELASDAAQSPTGCSMLLEFGIAPADAKPEIAQRLADMVWASGGRIATGFLGTPLILHALSKNSHVDAAYAMLLRTETPSWLYQVLRGATTIWERWDAIGPNGELNAGELDHDDVDNERQSDHSMVSFNHYAYGAVVDWIYQNIAGIGLDESSPGYRRFFIQPSFHRSINSASGEIETPYGVIKIGWNKHDSSVTLNVTIPSGSKGELKLARNRDTVVQCGGKKLASGAELGPGMHILEIINPAIVSGKP